VKMGQATIKAKKSNAALALVVADPSNLDERVSLVRLHAVLLKELGSITLTPSGPRLNRFQKVEVTVGSTPKPAALQLKGDFVKVSVLAEFSDGSQLGLNEDNGLILTSDAPRSVSVSTTLQQITVVNDAEADSGKLVVAKWQPGDDCDDRDVHTQPIDIEVVPPAASAIQVEVDGTFSLKYLVPVDDKAATAGYSTTAKLQSLRTLGGARCL
jgi:hypothetical protein